MASGERNGTSVLTESKVRAIKLRLRMGEAVRALAREYGVARNTITFIAKGEHWKHVNW
jgi:transposase-like protein